MSVLSESLLYGESQSTEERAAAIVSSYTFLTMGKVLAINSDSTLQVYTKSTVFLSVELLSLGTSTTAITITPKEGDTVMVFCFKNVQEDMSSTESTFSPQEYDMSYLKAIPISGMNISTQLNISDSGLALSLLNGEEVKSYVSFVNETGTIALKSGCNTVKLDGANTCQNNLTIDSNGYSLVTCGSTGLSVNTTGYSLVATCAVGISASKDVAITATGNVTLCSCAAGTLSIGNSVLTLGNALTGLIDAMSGMVPGCGWISPPATALATIKAQIATVFK